MIKLQFIRMYVVAGCVLSMVSCARQQAQQAAAPQAMPVKVQTVKEEPVGEYTEYLATLKSRNSSTIQPQVEGQITKIYAKAGEHVAAGAPLLEIDPLKQAATVNASEATRQSREAALQLAQQDLQRKKQLAAEGVISRQDLDQSQANFDAAKSDVAALGASVREQQVQLKYYTVRAPEAGIVGDIPVRVGDRVTNQTILTTLDRGGALEAYISVPAEKASDVKQGMKVIFLDEEGNAAGTSRINFVSPRVDPATQLLLVKTAVPNDGKYRNDQIVHVRVLWNERPSPVVPVLAVSRVSGQIFAFVVSNENGKTVARQKLLKVGDVVGNEYIVQEGVSAGDKLITSGVQYLVDGMPVVPQG